MADDPFPTTSEPTPAEIGTVEWSFVFPHDGDPGGNQPYARYKVGLLGADGELIEVKRGFLFRVGGPDHLLPTEKTALAAMNTRLRAKAEAVWIP